VANDDTSNGRRHDHSGHLCNEVACQRPSEGFGKVRPLKHFGALQVLLTMQAGGQQKVTIEQGAGFFENSSNFCGVHRTFQTTG
jgi:hypothetical protein